MKWTSLLFTLIVGLLYISLVFMGANVFFPDYGDYYYTDESCYTEREESYEVNETCFSEEKVRQDTYEEEQNAYNGNKYVFIVLVNLFVLLLAFFLTLESSVIVGLFLGSSLTSFFSTWIYFDTQSKVGFALLVLIFFSTIYFISKKKKAFQFA